MRHNPIKEDYDAGEEASAVPLYKADVLLSQ
jgi:hypothetical protein